jgi:hypothetical protein
VSSYLEDLPLVEKLRIVSLDEAVRLSGLSHDSLKRHHRDKLIKLSPRRLGMRLADCLLLPTDDIEQKGEAR